MSVLSALSLHPAPRERFISGRYVTRRERSILVPAGNFYSLSLREFFDSRFGPPDAIDAVHFILTRSTWLRSRSTSLTALRTGPWPAMAVTLTLEVQAGGRIQGKGGAGGKGGDGSSTGSQDGAPGATGGTAFLAEHQIAITGSGQIFGGGGGGGGGAGAFTTSPQLIRVGGGGGGGGSGTDGGSGGAGGFGDGAGQGQAGGNGSETSGGGGAGGGTAQTLTGGNGGNGGGLAENGAGGGSAGGSFQVAGSPGAGGAAGAAIDGVSLVTSIDPLLDIRGAQIN